MHLRRVATAHACFPNFPNFGRWNLDYNTSVKEKVIDAQNDTLPNKHLGELNWYMCIDYKGDRKAGTIEIFQTSHIRSV